MRYQLAFKFAQVQPAPRPIATLRHPAPIRQQPADAAMCYVGNQIYPKHDWSVSGPCRRCALPFPIKLT